MDWKGVGLAVAATLFGPLPAEAQRVRWIGDISCGTWLEGGSYREPGKAMALNYLLGYLAARANITKVDLLERTDIPAINQWVTTYCKAHPLDDITQGATQLEKELAQRAP